MGNTRSYATFKGFSTRKDSPSFREGSSALECHVSPEHPLPGVDYTRRLVVAGYKGPAVFSPPRSEEPFLLRSTPGVGGGLVGAL